MDYEKVFKYIETFQEMKNNVKKKKTDNADYRYDETDDVIEEFKNDFLDSGIVVIDYSDAIRKNKKLSNIFTTHYHVYPYSIFELRVILTYLVRQDNYKIDLLRESVDDGRLLFFIMRLKNEVNNFNKEAIFSIKKDAYEKIVNLVPELRKISDPECDSDYLDEHLEEITSKVHNIFMTNLGSFYTNNSSSILRSAQQKHKADLYEVHDTLLIKEVNALYYYMYKVAKYNDYSSYIELVKNGLAYRIFRYYSEYKNINFI